MATTAPIATYSAQMPGQMPIMRNTLPIKAIAQKVKTNMAKAQHAFTTQKGEGFIKAVIIFGKLIRAIGYILLALLVVYIIYYVMTKGYPRPFQIGHTESVFETKFMPTFITQVLDYLDYVALLPAPTDSKITDIQKAAMDFFAAFNTEFGIEIQKSKITVSPIQLNSTTYIYLFMFFIFIYDIADDGFVTGKSGNMKNCYDVLKSRLNPNVLKMVAALYNSTYSTYHELDPTTMTKFSNVYKPYATMCNALRAYNMNAQQSIAPFDRKHATEFGTQEQINMMDFAILLNIYVMDNNEDLKYEDRHNNINRMWRTRMTGGGIGSNWAIVGLYVKDYATYIWNEKIVNEIWKPYTKNAAKLVIKIQDAVTNPKVAMFIASLPDKLSGATPPRASGEGFTNWKAKREKLHHDEGKRDVVEHFGGLAKIILAFVYLAEVLVGIVNIITDPMAFILFIIGAILAIFLLVLYFLFCVLIDVFLAYVLGYVGLAIFNAAITWALMLCLVVYVIVYGTLGVLDMVTGGFIIGMLRCENVPDAWVTTSNWARNNRFNRTFFCSRSCYKRYYPDGLMCMRQSGDEPTYAPQQVIYQTWKNSQYITSVSDKIVYSHTPTPSYFVNTPAAEKMDMWSNVYDQQVSYMEECKTGFSYYDPMIKSMCMNMRTNSNAYTPDAQAKIQNLCEAAYCQGDDQSLPFCVQPTDASLLEKSKTKKDLVLTVITILLILVVLFIIITLIMNKDNIVTSNLIDNVTSYNSEFYGAKEPDFLTMIVP